MDFLDPKKRHRHKVRLVTGYILIGIALLLATTILLYQAYGYSIDKRGQIIQNGLLFLSSRPSAADILVNGERFKSQTNTRMQLPAGEYTLKLQHTGYHEWERVVTVNGGDVQHFDYPLLIPTTLTATAVKQYTEAPKLVSQSPDQRWLVVQASANSGEFELFNLTKPKEAPVALSLSADVLSTGEGAQSWQALEWSADNRHLLLKHLYQKSGQVVSEYVLLDRQTPVQSLNLTKALGVNPTKIALRDQAYDQYYLFDQATATLSQASLRASAPVAAIEHVLDFAAYGSDSVLFATDQGAGAGQVTIRLRQAGKTYPIRQLTAAPSYLLDLARYSGDWYMVAGSVADSKVYVYKNPIDTIKSPAQKTATPLRVLRVTAPTYIAFSRNFQFILAEGGTDVAVYDAENKRNYNYHLKIALDAGQQHVTWTDGYRLLFFGGGKAVLLDYDGTNQQLLGAADPALGVLFDPDFKAAYSFSATPTAEKPTLTAFTSTALLAPADQ